MRIDAIYEGPFSLCFLLPYVLLQYYAGSNPIGSKVFFFLLSTFFFTTHGYNELYYVRHKLETIKDWNFWLRIKSKTKKEGTDRIRTCNLPITSPEC